MIDQFWSPETNLRSDEYGGSLKNRMRFGIEVLEAVREAVGRDFCVGLRMCADEFNDNGIDHEVAKEIAQAMSETGLIDFISVIGSGADTHNRLANCMPPMALPPEPFVHLAAGIKGVSKVPVLHAQGIRDITQAERILANGWVDMCGMTRAQIADPHMMLKVREGREDQIKQCVGANYCIDRMYLGSGSPLRAEPRDLARGDDAPCHHADEGREAPRRRRGRGPRRTRGGAGVAGTRP